MRTIFKENRLAHKLSESFGESAKGVGANIKNLAKDAYAGPREAFRQKDPIGVIGGTVVSGLDVVFRSGDAIIQGIAGREVQSADVVDDVKNVVTSTAGAIGNLLTFKPIKALKSGVSAASSAFQAPQSALVQIGKGVTGTSTASISNATRSAATKTLAA